MARTNPIPALRKLAFLVAVSLLALLGVAVPLKHIWGFRSAVTVAGWGHGLLFTLFCVALFRTTKAARWPLSRAAMVFTAAALPFGPFLINRRMARFEEEFWHSNNSPGQS